MDKRLLITEDGSHSIELPGKQVTYHSRHGAISESVHVFIEAGYRYWWQQHPQANTCRVFEMGLGTGLNALLTFRESQQRQHNIHYTAVDIAPLDMSFVEALNYCQILQQDALQPVLLQLHTCSWGTRHQLAPHFTFEKVNTALQQFAGQSPFDIVYYDAFAPNAQPELWTEEIFQRLYNMLSPGGVLVTYCSKGAVQRAMKAAGFTIEKLPGPPHKREMVRAKKIGSKDHS
jgi:tRNA U34 5-methylaminomethyl-2-thiouridine-forming methyltransferase MnmC